MLIVKKMILCSLVACISTTLCSAGDKPLIELKTQQKSYVGKDLAHNDHHCWLISPQGTIDQVKLNEVVGFQKIAPKYKPHSKMEMKRHLQREFGRTLEIVGSSEYLVCAPKGHAKRYVDIFDQVYGDFRRYFSTRGLKLDELEFPLVAIVFPGRKGFLEYALADGVKNTSGLAGYYHPRSNRIALFDPSTAFRSSHIKVSSSSPPALNHLKPTLIPDVKFQPEIIASINGDLKDTLIHEATHQIAFNTGLHNRIGENPRWVVEGLAMVFESEDNRSNSSSGRPMQRVNRERYLHFGNYAQNRRPDQFLETFLSNDRQFKIQTLDAYSEAWAFSFFLMETRRREYATYLKSIASRDPMSDYPASERLGDFHNAFGDDLSRLETEYLRFIDRLN